MNRADRGHDMVTEIKVVTRARLAAVAAVGASALLVLGLLAVPTVAGEGEPEGLWSTSFSAGQVREDCGQWRVDGNGFCVADDSRNGLEVGVRFRADRALQITGTRLYRVDDAALRASLWGPDGALLARVEIPAGRAGGWQDVSFAEPVTVQPDQTYTTSYFSPRTRYAFRYGYFADRARTVGPVTALRSVADRPNGVHCYDDAPCVSFPVRGHRDSTYWVTPLWRDRQAAAPPTTAGPTPTTTPGGPSPSPTATPTGGPGQVDRVGPRVVATTPARGARRAGVGVRVRARFSEQVRPSGVASSSVRLTRRGSAKVVRARVTYRASRQQVVLRPRSPLAPRTTYRVVVSPRVRDVAGNRLDQDPGKPGRQAAAWTFRTR